MTAAEVLDADDPGSMFYVPATPTDVEVIDHPMPGAKPGEVLVRGATYSVVVYEIDSTVVAAVYHEGRLLRRDNRGWWTADGHGERCAVADLAVAELVGCVPAGWPCLTEQAPLLGVELLAEVSS